MEEGWETLDVAAQRLGRCSRHLRRLCQAWQAEGKARKAHPPAGGKARWLIRADMTLPDRAAQPGRIVPTTFDPMRLTMPQRNELYKRETIVLGWKGELKDCPKSKRCKRCDKYLLRIAPTMGTQSRANLYRLTALYEQSGLAGLVDGRWMNAARRASAAMPSVEPNNSPLATPAPQRIASEPAAAMAATITIRIGKIAIEVPPGTCQADVSNAIRAVQVAFDTSKKLV